MRIVSRSYGSLATLCFVVTMACSLTGCTPQAKLGERVEGTVTVRSVPMSEGLIAFDPLRTTPGPKITCEILDGKFTIGEDQGLQAGEFRIEILGIPPGIRAMAEGKNPHDVDQKSYREIDDDFNVKSILKFSIESGKLNQPSFDVRYRD